MNSKASRITKSHFDG